MKPDLDKAETMIREEAPVEPKALGDSTSETSRLDCIGVSSSRGRLAPGELGGRLRGLSLRRQVLVLAIWPFLEFALGSAVSFTDMAIAGRMEGGGVDNTPILDALSFGSYIGWLLFILQGAVGTGANALVSRAIGARDHSLAKRAMGQAILLGVIAGSISMLLLLVFKHSLISFVGLSVEAGIFANEYISILAFSAPITGLIVAVNACLRGSGDTRTPFGVTVVVNLVNVIFSLGFVYFWNLGVTGIAWGTVCGWGVGAGLVLWKVSSRRQAAKRRRLRGVGLRLLPRSIKHDGEISRRILRVGMPSAAEILGMWAINFTGLRFIEQLQLDGALGAHGVAVRLESLSFLPGFALGVAAQTLAGQYLGASNAEKASAAVREAWKIGVIFMTSVGLLFVLVPEILVSTIAPDNAQVMELAVPLLRLCGVTQPFFATTLVHKMAMRGAGASRLVMQWSFASMVIYRLLGLWLVVNVFDGNLFFIWVVISCDLTTQALIFSRLHFSDKWKTVDV